MVAWKLAIEAKDHPTSLIFSRQNLAHQIRSAEQIANIEKGGYVLKDAGGELELIIIATGSEVQLAMEVSRELDCRGIESRVVSMPSTDVFDRQPEAYRESVLPKAVTKRIAIEAGSAEYWAKYVGLEGAVIGMTSFGESAPAEELFEHFGFTLENALERVKD